MWVIISKVRTHTHTHKDYQVHVQVLQHAHELWEGEKGERGREGKRKGVGVVMYSTKLL